MLQNVYHNKVVTPHLTSGQDGGVGRYASLPRRSKRRTAINLKTKSNQNCQKIELYEGLTTKELKKKHSSRLGGGVERAGRAEKTHGKVVDGGPGGLMFVCR